MIKSCFLAICVTILGYFFIDAIKCIGLAHPAHMKGLAKIIKAISFDRWILVMLSATTTTAWLCERKGKKRAIKRKGELQRKLEAQDPNRSTSSLSSIGETK